MYKFEYEIPLSVDDAVAKFEASDDATYISGGMTLVPTLKQRLAMPSHLIDLSKIPSLSGISLDGDMLKIGAMTTHAQIAKDPLVTVNIPALAILAEGIGDASVRNRGTIGGSIANSDPSADYPAAVLALSAEINTNKRTIAAADFFVELFETALEEGEIITSVSLPVNKVGNYQKFSNPASRYAIVGVFVAKTNAGVRVAVTGAGAYVFRMNEMETALDNDFSAKSIENIEISDQGLNEDAHASAAYRANLIKVLTSRAIKTLS